MLDLEINRHFYHKSDFPRNEKKKTKTKNDEREIYSSACYRQKRDHK